jgi:hypothetical protein
MKGYQKSYVIVHSWGYKETKFELDSRNKKSMEEEFAFPAIANVSELGYIGR